MKSQVPCSVNCLSPDNSGIPAVYHPSSLIAYKACKMPKLKPIVGSHQSLPCAMCQVGLQLQRSIKGNMVHKDPHKCALGPSHSAALAGSLTFLLCLDFPGPLQAIFTWGSQFHAC